MGAYRFVTGNRGESRGEGGRERECLGNGSAPRKGFWLAQISHSERVETQCKLIGGATAQLRWLAIHFTPCCAFLFVERFCHLVFLSKTNSSKSVPDAPGMMAFDDDNSEMMSSKR
jgi:hypothetical protein